MSIWPHASGHYLLSLSLIFPHQSYRGGLVLLPCRTSISRSRIIHTSFSLFFCLFHVPLSLLHSGDVQIVLTTVGADGQEKREQDENTLTCSRMVTKNHQNNDKPYKGFRWRSHGHDVSLRRKSLMLWVVVPFMLELGTGLRDFFQLQEWL